MVVVVLRHSILVGRAITIRVTSNISNNKARMEDKGMVTNSPRRRCSITTLVAVAIIRPRALADSLEASWAA